MGLDMYSKESGMLHSEAYLSIDCADYKKPIFTIADDKEETNGN